MNFTLGCQGFTGPNPSTFQNKFNNLRMWRKERQIKQLLQLFNLDNPRDKIRVFYRVGIIMKKRGLKSLGKKGNLSEY